MKKTNTGFSLIEIAISIVLIGGLLTLTIISLNFQFTRQKRNSSETRANLIAQEAIEIAYNISINNWTIIDSYDNGLDYHPVITTGTWNLQAGSETLYSDFERTLTITPVNRDGNGDIVTTGGTPDDNTRLLTVSVTWDQSPIGTQTITQTEYLLKPTAVTEVLCAGGACGPTSSCTVSRVEDNLIALYEFTNDPSTTADDSTVPDTTVIPSKNPVPLTISDTSKIQWLHTSPNNKGLRILDPTARVTSTGHNTGGNRSKIVELIKDSNEFTVELWYRPLFTSQTGREGGSRVFTLSNEEAEDEQELIFGLELNDLLGRQHITRYNGGAVSIGDASWLSTYSSTSGLNPFNENSLSHMVYSHQKFLDQDQPPNTGTRLYHNGVVVDSRDIFSYAQGGNSQDFRHWRTNAEVSLGNTPYISGIDPALGEYYLLAIYDRAIDDWEVNQNYQAGPNGDCSIPSPLPNLIYNDARAGLNNDSSSIGTWSGGGVTGWSNSTISPATTTDGFVDIIGNDDIWIVGSGHNSRIKDIVGNDQYEFLYLTLNNSTPAIEITAKVEEWRPLSHNLSSFGNPNSQIGVMMRNSLDHAAAVFYDSIDGNGYASIKYRETDGDKTAQWRHYNSTGSSSYPRVAPRVLWMKIIKDAANNVGVFYTHHNFTNNISPPAWPGNWTFFADTQLTISGDYYIGFAITAGQNGDYAAAHLTNITVDTSSPFNLCSWGSACTGGSGGGPPGSPDPGASPPPTGGGVPD